MPSNPPSKEQVLELLDSYMKLDALGEEFTEEYEKAFRQDLRVSVRYTGISEWELYSDNGWQGTNNYVINIEEYFSGCGEEGITFPIEYLWTSNWVEVEQERRRLEEEERRRKEEEYRLEREAEHEEDERAKFLRLYKKYGHLVRESDFE